ncbi:MAG: hypothetical protein ACOYMW_04245 [Candidatus Competibacteraceae bacterium]
MKKTRKITPVNKESPVYFPVMRYTKKKPACAGLSIKQVTGRGVNQRRALGL